MARARETFISLLNKTLNKIFTPKRCLFGAILLIISYIIVFSTICIRRYNSFAYHDWDFAIYANVMWNLIHGKLYSSIFAENFLREHASLIAFLLAIPYFIFRNPLTLLILQTFA